jgi:hypothetical protein
LCDGPPNTYIQLDEREASMKCDLNDTMQFNAVAASNRSAVDLYKRIGFSIVGTVPGAFAHVPRIVSPYVTIVLMLCSEIPFPFAHASL